MIRGDEDEVPAWLQGLMAETFFASCGVHHNRRKNDKNIFCLICCLSFCPHCLPHHHPSHPLLQVRRYVYQDVIRLDDLEKLIDCAYIQSYTINSAKVIFLNQRAHSKSNCKGSSSAANSCFMCDRILQDPFHFCSLSCKVGHVVYEGEDMSNILTDVSDFTLCQLEGLDNDDGGHITPNSILEYGSSNYETGSSESREDTKNNEGGFIRGGIMLSLSSRRKGAPQRSPLS